MRGWLLISVEVSHVGVGLRGVEEGGGITVLVLVDALVLRSASLLAHLGWFLVIVGGLVDANLVCELLNGLDSLALDACSPLVGFLLLLDLLGDDLVVGIPALAIAFLEDCSQLLIRNGWLREGR